MAICLTAGSPAPAESPDDLLIVVNLRVKQTDLSVDLVRKMFLRERTVWPGTTAKVIPIHAKFSTPEKDAFLKRVIGMTAAQEQRFWENQKVRTGRTPPPAFSNQLKAVFSLNNAIGYIFRKNYKPNVSRILLIIPEETRDGS